MSQTNINDALNRLMALTCRSFPMYLTHAKPFITRGDREAMRTIAQIVADQIQLSQRISAAIQAHHGRLELGDFPMEFTDTHDLSVDYIVHLAIAYQKQDVASIAEIVDELRFSTAAGSLAEEALGMAKGHLQSLEELASQPA